MATKEVLFSVCDRCGHDERTDVEKVPGKPGRKSQKTLLPPRWIHVTAKSALVPEMIALDLCGECAKQVLLWLQPTEHREGE